MYKVVNDSLKSVIMDDYANNGLVVQYKLGEFVSAPEKALEKGYGLCVFPTLEAAKSFSFGNPIYECEVINQLLQLPLYGTIHSTNLLHILLDTVETHHSGWANHTIMVESVKLLKQV